MFKNTTMFAMALVLFCALTGCRNKKKCCAYHNAQTEHVHSEPTNIVTEDSEIKELN